jgi:anti-sigma B factor antagonist
LDLTIEERRAAGDVYVLNLAGEVDIASSPNLSVALCAVIERGHYNLVVDLERVRHIDSTGLGVLVRGLKDVREHGGNITLIYSDPQLKKLLEITGIAQLFESLGK